MKKKQHQISTRGARQPVGRKIWCFRVASLILAPLACLALLEVGLRLAGIGYPTSFLRPVSIEDRRLLVQNNQFGWRFFGPHMARTPYPISIPQSKTPGTIRIFVLGESAAYGDPQPRFGLSRMLRSLLELRHPGVRFEVVNAAMTGINSHVIRPIAIDCAQAGGDIWVLYIGNNEVVGPFGAGTIFGPRTPPLFLARARIAILATRTGQWLDSILRRLRPRPLSESEWGGMKMFLNHPVRANDPQLATVYHHFERNLRDILRLAHRGGAAVVVSTVASNLRDSGPFGSGHRADLSELERAQWDNRYNVGVSYLRSGDYESAAAAFQEAAGIDDTVAVLRFRQGECAVGQRDIAAAQRHFQAARDLDTLRFRCDSRMNEIIRQVAAGRESERIRWVDSARFMAVHSATGLPGDELFVDHVHFTFQGTYLLATAVAEQVELLLPESVRAVQKNTQPSIDQCAARLGWTDRSREAIAKEMLQRHNDAPFVGQVTHPEQVSRLKSFLRENRSGARQAGLNSDRKVCQAAVAAAPDDPELYEELGIVQEEAGDLGGAEDSIRRATHLLPTSSEAWALLGRIQAARRQFAAAVGSFRQAVALDPQEVASMHNLGQALEKLGDHRAAMLEFRRAVEIKPRFGLAWLGLGQVLEETGRKEEARDCFNRALSSPVRRAGDLLAVARFCQSRGWLAEAVTNYSAAIQLSPMDPKLYVEIGQTLGAMGRHAEAASFYEELVTLTPEAAEAHFLYGVELGRVGRTSAAVTQFREAARLNPELIEAHLNLGIALMNDGNPQSALEAFDAVLRRSPTNVLALRHAQALRDKLSVRAR